MASANDIVNQARAWLGKNEANGSFKEIIDIYNSHKPLARGYTVKYTDSWCSTFVSAVSIKCGATSIFPTECGCEKHIELFKALGSWIEDESITPKAGDVIFYDWDDNGVGDNKGYADHVGIVESVSNGVITIIEGNNNSAVRRRTIAVNGRCIRGYGRPKYTGETSTPTQNIDTIAKEVIAGKWGNGEDRKNNLTNAGYNYAEVQSRVNAILNGSGNVGKKSDEEIAREVIRGDWGNGADRKNRLTASGYDYYTIQSIVNMLL